MYVALVLALIGAALLVTGVIGFVNLSAEKRRRNDRAIELNIEKRRLLSNIQMLEHSEMTPPYDHVGCYACDCSKIDRMLMPQDYEDPEEYEIRVEQLSGPVTLIKHRPLDVRPAEYDYIGKPPKAIAQPETIRR
jgi:hypothetical protein